MQNNFLNHEDLPLHTIYTGLIFCASDLGQV